MDRRLLDLFAVYMSYHNATPRSVTGVGFAVMLIEVSREEESTDCSAPQSATSKRYEPTRNSTKSSFGDLGFVIIRVIWWIVMFRQTCSNNKKFRHCDRAKKVIVRVLLACKRARYVSLAVARVAGSHIA